MITKIELLSLIDAYASKKSLVASVETMRIAVSRKDRAHTNFEVNATKDAKALYAELQAAVEALPIN